LTGIKDAVVFHHYDSGLVTLMSPVMATREPTTFLLLGSGLAGLALLLRKQKVAIGWVRLSAGGVLSSLFLTF
jgi:hypothetical protein